MSTIKAELCFLTGQMSEQGDESRQQWVDVLSTQKADSIGRNQSWTGGCSAPPGDSPKPQLRNMARPSQTIHKVPYENQIVTGNTGKTNQLR